MAVTAKIYPLGIMRAYAGDMGAVDTDVIKCALLTSSYTPSQLTHQAWTTSCSAYEVTGTGYTAGGATLTDVTIGLKTATTTFQFWASECSWTNSTITARYAVIYSVTTGYLISYVDFGEDKSSAEGLFKIDFDDTDGIFEITT